MSDDAENKRYHEELSDTVMFRVGTYVKAIKEQRLLEMQKNERKKVDQFLELHNSMSDMLDDIEGMLKDYLASRDRQNRLREMIDMNDIDGIRLMFTDEYYMNPDDVAAMNNEQIIDQADRFDKQETLRQKTLIEGIKSIVVAYRDKTNEAGELTSKLEDEYLNALNRLEEQYKSVLEADFDIAFADAWQSDKGNRLYDTGRSISDHIEENKRIEKQVTTAPCVTEMNSGLKFN